MISIRIRAKKGFIKTKYVLCTFSCKALGEVCIHWGNLSVRLSYLSFFAIYLKNLQATHT